MLTRCRTIPAVVLIVVMPMLSQVTEQEHESRLDVAVRLARILNPPETYEEREKQFDEAILPLFAVEANQVVGHSLLPDSAEKIRKVMDDLRPSYDAWTRMSAQAYAAHFSVDEMTDMIRFYSSPTGAKMQKVMPQIAVEITRQQMTEWLPTLREAVRKEGLIK